MAYKKYKKESKVFVKQVPNDKSKIKFFVVLEGEMNWNELFGMKQEDDMSLCHDDSDFRYGGENFSQSLINYLYKVIARDDDYKIFQKAKLTNLDISEEVLESYQSFKKEVESREKAKKLDRLKEVEKEAAKLRSEVLEEFGN